jgi:1-acyl-sn-glycerol-3-phosphate acyltransferase
MMSAQPRMPKATLRDLVLSWVHLVFMVGTLVPWATLAIVLSFVLRPTPLYWFCTVWMRMVVGGAHAILGIRYRVEGAHNLPADTNAPAILLAKHQSAWETFALPVIMPHPLAFVFKKELLYIPFFGWAIARLNMIHIDRSKRSEAFAKVVQQGKKLLNQGVWVIMFPEGTRIARGEVGTYKTGGTRLAIQTGAPVIPIAITSARCWPRKALIKRRGEVVVSIGAPIASEGRQPEEMMQEVQQWIEAEMRRLDPEAYTGVQPAKAVEH